MTEVPPSRNGLAILPVVYDIDTAEPKCLAYGRRAHSAHVQHTLGHHGPGRVQEGALQPPLLRAFVHRRQAVPRDDRRLPRQRRQLVRPMPVLISYIFSLRVDGRVDEFAAHESCAILRTQLRSFRPICF